MTAPEVKMAISSLGQESHKLVMKMKCLSRPAKVSEFILCSSPSCRQQHPATQPARTPASSRACTAAWPALPGAATSSVCCPVFLCRLGRIQRRSCPSRAPDSLHSPRPQLRRICPAGSLGSVRAVMAGCLHN